MRSTNEIKLKVCGMRDKANIMAVAALHPDYMGFIFYVKSPRYVQEDFELPDNFPASIKRVGVFVNENTKVILNHAKRLGLHCVQLHGNERVAQCEELKQEGLGVIKVFSVGEDFDFEITKPYKKIADFFLFDTKGKYHGGNAKTFDWRMLNQYDQEVPFFLSGGLTPENMNEVSSLAGMNMHALDVNSGVELSPGLKDLNKLETLKNNMTSKF
jgi:phosphoribosylanthranilate isomerase